MPRISIPAVPAATIVRWSSLYADTLAHLAALGRSQHTILNYENAYRQFAAYLFALKLDDEAKHFTEERVLGFMGWLHQHGAGPNTVNARLCALQAVSKYGAKVRDGRGRPVVPVDPLTDLERPRHKRPAEKFLLPQELHAFLALDRPLRDHVARALLMDTGLRRAELCRASFCDLFEIQGTTLLQVLVKGGETVQVPLSPEIATLLFEWRLARNVPDVGEPLLIDHTGARYAPSAFGALIVRLGRAAGITRLLVTPHVIRHTLELIRRRAGIDSTIRSKLLTHSSLGSLISYQHTLPDELVAARQQQVDGLHRYLGNYRTQLSAPPAEEARKPTEC